MPPAARSSSAVRFLVEVDLPSRYLDYFDLGWPDHAASCHLWLVYPSSSMKRHARLRRFQAVSGFARSSRSHRLSHRTGSSAPYFSLPNLALRRIDRFRWPGISRNPALRRAISGRVNDLVIDLCDMVLLISSAFGGTVSFAPRPRHTRPAAPAPGRRHGRRHRARGTPELCRRAAAPPWPLAAAPTAGPSDRPRLGSADRRAVPRRCFARPARYPGRSGVRGASSGTLLTVHAT